MSGEDETKALTDALKSLSLDSPSFPPLLEEEKCFAQEFDAPIALADNGFLASEKEKDEFQSMYKRAKQWCTDAGVTEEDIATAKKQLIDQITSFNAKEGAEFDRIFIRDAERSLNTPTRRTLLCHVLTVLQEQILNKDYHQGISMIATFLMLFLETPAVLAMLTKAQTNPKYLPNVWKSESIVAVTDGYVLTNLISAHLPRIHNAYKRVGLIPELYASKLWCALGVHVLPFQSLVKFFDDFWANGSIAVFRLALLMAVRQEESIVMSDSVGKVLELLRFDPTIVHPHDANVIAYCIPKPESNSLPTPESSADSPESAPPTPELQSNSNVPEAAVSSSVTADETKYAEALKRVQDIIDTITPPNALATLRETMFNTHLKARLERAQKDFAKPKVPDCKSGNGSCTTGKEQGFYWCKDCKRHMCEDCGFSQFDGHDGDVHDVRINEDASDIEDA